MKQMNKNLKKITKNNNSFESLLNPKVRQEKISRQRKYARELLDTIKPIDPEFRRRTFEILEKKLK
jgi:hemerythrin superfamily protein